ncbi:uncharacterized protein LOC124119103 isoform X1 [Haliotis rufescens]|uniref:uncharacterized protein LOC124119103 isoform X1 n=1 Tax=Haliotis rufescens TaxID=6454 RepID=UPI00201F1987|nr:uncharacterized protein LOC124119103 isoform X1 [Haliotis rufescens]
MPRFAKMDAYRHIILRTILLITAVDSYVLASRTIPISKSPDLSLTITDDDDYNLNINGRPWLFSESTFFRADGRMFSVEEGTLTLISVTNRSGVDRMGQWNSVDFLYKAGSHQMQTSVMYYIQPIYPLVLFKQKYLDDVHDASATLRDETISGFPSFQVVDKSDIGLGYLSYGGMMTGDTRRKFGKWGEVMTDYNQGITDGPLAIFDKNQTATTFVISPASKFMIASMWHKSVLNVQGAAHWGLLGSVDDVPQDFEMMTIAYCGGQGINKALEDWGTFLQHYYGRDDRYVKSDLTVNYIGYWTDNGAYYYYNTVPGKNYEDTMLDIVSYFPQTGIPFKYIQYDSWWYFKGLGDGVKTWVGRPDVFPHGMQWVYNKTGLPVSAHNKFWSGDTTYAKQNGGKYNFIIEGSRAVPDDQTFWDDLLKSGREWGLITYEQDWLNHEFVNVKALQTNVSLGERWLKQMGQAGIDNNVTIQYCMSNSRHILQALEIPSVTQARVSMDYHPGLEQWKIGVSSIFAHAMGIRPYKDTFWTTRYQPGNKYIGGTSEPNTELNALIATLSTGPVGPGDMIGAFNASIIMKSVNADGKILKPSKPATAIDNQIRRLAFGADFNGPSGEVYTTYSDFGGMWKFGIILAADLLAGYTITPTDAGFQQLPQFPTSRVFSHSSTSSIDIFTDDTPLVLSGCSTVAYCLHYTSPTIAMGDNTVVVVLGELDKWVPMSPQRVVWIRMDTDVSIRITGAPSEVVTFWFSLNDQVVTVKCILGPKGFATILARALKCTPE